MRRSLGAPFAVVLCAMLLRYTSLSLLIKSIAIMQSTLSCRCRALNASAVHFFFFYLRCPSDFICLQHKHSNSRKICHAVCSSLRPRGLILHRLSGRRKTRRASVYRFSDNIMISYATHTLFQIVSKCCRESIFFNV